MYQHPPGGKAPRPPAPPAPLLPPSHCLAGAERADHAPGPRQRAQLGDGGAQAAGVGQLKLDAVQGCVLLHCEVL